MHGSQNDAAAAGGERDSARAFGRTGRKALGHGTAIGGRGFGNSCVRQRLRLPGGHAGAVQAARAADGASGAFECGYDCASTTENSLACGWKTGRTNRARALRRSCRSEGGKRNAESAGSRGRGDDPKGHRTGNRLAESGLRGGRRGSKRRRGHLAGGSMQAVFDYHGPQNAEDGRAGDDLAAARGGLRGVCDHSDGV